MKKHTWTIAFASCLLAFTVFLGMDTFVLSSAYQTDATGMNTEMFARAEVSAGKTGQDQENPTLLTDRPDTDLLMCDKHHSPRHRSDNHRSDGRRKIGPNSFNSDFRENRSQSRKDCGT
jgi:hypothetical protein